VVITLVIDVSKCGQLHALAALCKEHVMGSVILQLLSLLSEVLYIEKTLQALQTPASYIIACHPTYRRCIMCSVLIGSFFTVLK